ncbi:hypothetical protein COU53_00400 [Candidatus Pacearchaeota archaeon CG10_big_fil_rev_8_21_14_0_10_30_48]|nr:MAG: hypothetical protein COU53_00400 [Candidatus Pacearchaeota archaeon CG10_big_fil_rev_8_21_14_0_10_30_48]
MNLRDIVHKIGFHSWDDWEYVSQKSCEQIRTCDYDRVTQERTRHKWSDPEYKSLDSCEQIRKCYHCEEIESLGTYHPSAIGGGCYTDQICRNCEEQLDDHMNG